MLKIDHFDYSIPAELYAFNKRRGSGPSMTYRKFKTAAIAIRYLIEEFPGSNLAGTILEVNEERYRQKEIRKLYDDSAYPLRRKTGEDSDAEKNEL